MGLRLNTSLFDKLLLGKSVKSSRGLFMSSNDAYKSPVVFCFKILTVFIARSIPVPTSWLVLAPASWTI